MSTATIYYLITLAVYFFQYIILVLGYNLTFGLTGIINIALFAVVAMGGYLGAVVTMGPSGSYQMYILGANLPYPLPLLVGGVAGALLSLALGFVILRLRDQYQAIVTLVIAQVLWLVVGNWQPLFNGYLGIVSIPQPLEKTLNLAPLNYQYFLLAVNAVVAVIVFAFMYWVNLSPYARVLRAVREDEVVAAALGKNVYMLQMAALVTGGFILGVGGALIAEFLTTVSPSMWAPPEAFVVIATLLIGGTGNNWGAVVGAFIVPVGIYELTQLIPAFGSSSNLVDALRWIVIGLLVLFFLWFRPDGLIREPKRRYPERHRLSLAQPEREQAMTEGVQG